MYSGLFYEPDCLSVVKLKISREKKQKKNCGVSSRILLRGMCQYIVMFVSHPLGQDIFI